MSNDENPYSPPASRIAEPDPDWDRAVAIARSQRHVLWALLASLLLVPLPGAMLIVGPVRGLFTYRLARHVYAGWAAILITMLSMLPLFGLLVLLAINARATRALREYGLHVGFLGVDPGALELRS